MCLEPKVKHCFEILLNPEHVIDLSKDELVHLPARWGLGEAAWGLLRDYPSLIPSSEELLPRGSVDPHRQISLDLLPR